MRESSGVETDSVPVTYQEGVRRSFSNAKALVGPTLSAIALFAPIIAIADDAVKTAPVVEKVDLGEDW